MPFFQGFHQLLQPINILGDARLPGEPPRVPREVGQRGARPPLAHAEPRAGPHPPHARPEEDLEVEGVAALARLRAGSAPWHQAMRSRAMATPFSGIVARRVLSQVVSVAW
eukprot:CAMPEP_0194573144 /NCGR_PEP_ID=MMETSP0292-20121207/9458_1 /TAXON_ID=39354 /ORGANISM="Heterosigma akashiwo, Strain CCMP2393" /LENGTH=110 /DNA_ID=CAMNT_0039424297 /DNA_START=193 /DNA_END=523 /DNA_ORIENTATION=+